ncbi:NAD-dependent malic enzyme [Frankia sp. Cppng1_Ct_nod]|uniref:NAD-dependent malic enzyme n=1 Tax=Frankia sp. Cppng1_Ct_nod TaxID=2897162 RepID=UPI0032E9E392
MAVPSVSFSITVRLEVPASSQTVGEITTAVGKLGGAVTALDVAESHADRLILDMTCLCADSDQAQSITETLRSMPDFVVRRVSDRVFLLHLGGKIEVTSKVPLRTRDDLSMAYTPGVARVCLAIADRPDDARRLTVKRNSVAVVSDGSAVLGLGNIGPAAAIPVMEGKAALFKRFADIDAWPICLATQDVDEIVRTVTLLAPVFGGINLEDIAAPRCFEIERRLRELLDIPVFHDDQHGTAIVVLAALTNALRVVGKSLESVRIVTSGAGAAGTAVLRLLLRAGAGSAGGSVIVSDIGGIISRSRDDLDDNGRWICEHTNPDGVSGTLRDALVDADVFVGVSAPGILIGADIATMAGDAIVFALANPDPEVDPTEARRYATIVATGRSDEPNQINNVLAFPGVFRGLLDSHAHDITEDMLLAAADALAAVLREDEINPLYIVPSVFDERVMPAVAEAVSGAARTPAGVAGVAGVPR